MACGCDDKYTKVAPKVEEPKPKQNIKLAFDCICGIRRLLPSGMKPNTVFDMPACPKCGHGFRAHLTEEGIEEIV